jgi:hypothetical protein
VTVPVGAGMMGKAEVRKFGANVEIYVKAADPGLAIPKGAAVRVVDFSEEFYTVEPLEGPTEN